MAIRYNPSFLDNIPKINEKDKIEIARLNKEYSLNKFLTNVKNVESLSLDFIYSSAQIEGNTYSKLDTLTLIKYGQTAGGKKYTDAVMISNLRDAVEIVLNSDYSVDYLLLCDLHSVLCNKLLQNNQLGIVRKESVTIGGSEYIPLNNSEQLIEEMKYLFSMLDRIDDPIEKAIYAHLNIAYLQFFIDGNKRTARMLQTAITVKNNVMPLLFDEKHIKDYVASLIMYYETGNYNDYVKWFITNYYKMYEKLNPKIDVKINRSASFIDGE